MSTEFSGCGTPAHEAGAPPLICGLLLARRAGQLSYSLANLGPKMFRLVSAILWTSCVQEGGFEGPEIGPMQRRINNRLLSYRPQHRGEPLTTTSLYGSLARFAIVRNLRFGTRQQLLRCIYHARSPNHSSVHRGMYSPRSVKMQWQRWKVQCFSAFPIYKQNHNGGRSKTGLVKGGALPLRN